MENVLIVGNGFDRQLGLKTDYISFLDWYRNKYKNNISSFFFSLSEEIGFEPNEFDIGKLEYNSQIEYFEKVITKVEKNQRGREFNIKLSNNKLKTMNLDRFDYELIFFLAEYLKQEYKHDISQSCNIWFLYLEFLRVRNTKIDKSSRSENLYFLSYKKVLSGYIGENGNWIDLEGIISRAIQYSIEGLQNPRTAEASNNYFISIYRFFRTIVGSEELLKSYHNTDFKDIEPQIKKRILDDFLDFKKKLTEYLKEIANNKREYKTRYIKESKKKSENQISLDLNNYDKIITFNYTV